MSLTNRLSAESSPYLRQHAGNPVDWYPWGAEAFAEAAKRDAPILLSVGYSACHWCHVMAHESFEDSATARLMNDNFVCVKVDREERPDVDAVYMEAVQALTGSGGWPMTVFLAPDGRPFHGGTYYPRAQFGGLLQQIAVLWKERRQDVEAAADQLATAVRSGTSLPRSEREPDEPIPKKPEPELLEPAADALVARFDPEWGGLGRAPKFPQPAMLEALLVAARRGGRGDVLSAVITTLDAMAAGGIYDHLGGGFARYSTDREWLVPHFEKMLYDNALLIRVYLHAWQLTHDARYRQVVEETVGYLLRGPIRIAGAGFASAEDADSEGEEGRFYVWDEHEVIEVGGRQARDWYGVTAAGNWEGRNILRRPVGAPLDRPPAVEESRQALFDRREGRVRPGLDDKILTEWNAMAVAALAEAGAALDRPAWVAEAEAVGRFLVESLRDGGGRWLRSWQAGTGAKHLSYAADHAWLTEAFIQLYQATGRSAWVEAARETADALLELFWDPSLQAFATIGKDAERLIARPVDSQDGALPSANSTAAMSLLRLGALTGVDRYREHAEAVIDSMRPSLAVTPIAFMGMVTAAEHAGAGLTEIVITGERPDLLRAVNTAYLPGAVVAWGEPFDTPLWEGRTAADARDLAFVCRNYACRAPVADAGSLAAELAR